MALQVYPPSIIVRNLRTHFFSHRDWAEAPRGLAAEEAPPVLDDDRVVEDMNQFGYVRLDATARRPRGRRDWVVILVLKAGGKYARHLPDLRRLVEGVGGERAAREGRLDELILVVDDDFFGQKNLTALMREAQLASRKVRRPGGEPGAHPDPDGAAPFYNVYRYRNFALVVPEHKAVARHRVMPVAEVHDRLERYHETRDAHKVILTTDPPIVWNGGREGQFVEITRDSPTAGTAVDYRRIELGPL